MGSNNRDTFEGKYLTLAPPGNFISCIANDQTTGGNAYFSQLYLQSNANFAITSTGAHTWTSTELTYPCLDRTGQSANVTDVFPDTISGFTTRSTWRIVIHNNSTFTLTLTTASNLSVFYTANAAGANNFVINAHAYAELIFNLYDGSHYDCIVLT